MATVESPVSRKQMADKVVNHHDFSGLAQLYGPIASYNETGPFTDGPTVMGDAFSLARQGMPWKEALVQVLGEPEGGIRVALDRFFEEFDQTYLSLRKKLMKDHLHLEGGERLPNPDQWHVEYELRQSMYLAILKLRRQSQD